MSFLNVPRSLTIRGYSLHSYGLCNCGPHAMAFTIVAVMAHIVMACVDVALMYRSYIFDLFKEFDDMILTNKARDPYTGCKKMPSRRRPPARANAHTHTLAFLCIPSAPRALVTVRACTSNTLCPHYLCRHVSVSARWQKYIGIVVYLLPLVSARTCAHTTFSRQLPLRQHPNVTKKRQQHIRASTAFCCPQHGFAP